MSAPDTPLAGVQVLDLSRVLAGPYCTMLLADLGAEVIKVEKPGEGDETRTWGPPSAGGEAAYYLSVNRSKRSCAIDLAAPEGRDLALSLARGADVVIENFKPGGAGRLGLAYEDVREINPNVVYCSISGYGSARDNAASPSYDFIAQAETGLMAITGPVEGPPSKVGVAVVDLFAGYNATVGILAALNRRQRTGAGEHLEVSLLDSGLGALANVAANALVTGTEPGRHGNAHASVVPYELFQTADGWLAIGALNGGTFRRLCGALGVPALADDPRFSSNESRVEHRELLIPQLAERFAGKASAEWLGLLSAASVPAGEVRGVLDALRAPARTGDPATITVSHPTAGELELVRNPIRLSQGVLRDATAPPLLGQHTDEVLRELGLPDDEIAALERRAVVQRAL